MSDIPLGPGWWQASDGKWYHPDLHPSARAVRNTATVAAPAEEQTAFGAAESPGTGSPSAEPPAAGPAGAGSSPESSAAEPSWPYPAEPSGSAEPGPSRAYANEASSGYGAEPSPSYGADSASTFAGRASAYAEPGTGYPEASPTYTEPPGYGQAGQLSQPAPAGSRPSHGGVPEPFHPATTQASSHAVGNAWWVNPALVAAFGLLLVGASWAISAVASFQTAPSEWYARLFAVAAAAGWLLVAIAAALLARNGATRRGAAHNRR